MIHWDTVNLWMSRSKPLSSDFCFCFCFFCFFVFFGKYIEKTTKTKKKKIKPNKKKGKKKRGGVRSRLTSFYISNVDDVLHDLGI
jgi:hypothetical protein